MNTKTPPTKYPILLVHGLGYRDRGKPYYWGRISKTYENAGAVVYFGDQDSWGTIHNNALTLRRTLNRIIEETGAEKVNLIAHSKGGLESRYLASGLNCADKIASITTISTPHRGSKVMDTAMTLFRPFIWISGFIMDGFNKITGDKNPDFFKVCDQFRTKNMEKFNIDYPDKSGIYYQSYASVMRSPGSDLLMAFQNAVVSCFEGENDGLISPESAKWGEFKGIWRGNTKRGVSHADSVDIRRRPFSDVDGEGIKDIVDAYMEILLSLKERGL